MCGPFGTSFAANGTQHGTAQGCAIHLASLVFYVGRHFEAAQGLKMPQTVFKVVKRRENRILAVTALNGKMSNKSPSVSKKHSNFILMVLLDQTVITAKTVSFRAKQGDK